MPALSALLSDPSREVFSNRGPLLGTFFLHKSQDEGIFFDAPRPFDKVRIQHLLPPVQTLHISPSLQALGYFLPISAPELRNSNGKLLILFSGPMTFVGPILIFCRTSFIYIWIFFLTSNYLLLFCSLEIITAWRCLV